MHNLFIWNIHKFQTNYMNSDKNNIKFLVPKQKYIQKYFNEFI